MLDGVAAQPPAGSGREQRVGCVASAFGDPHREHGPCRCRERDGPVFSPFASDADVRAGVEHEIAAVDPDQLGDAQAGLDREHQHRAVAAAFPSVRIGCVDQSLAFGLGEERDGPPLESGGRDAEHALDHCSVLWVAQCGVAKQGSDRGEPQVAGPRAVVPVVLEVLKERGDDGFIELVPFQLSWRAAAGLMHKAEQQPKRVAVGRDRARADVALLEQTLGEERLEGRGDQGHDAVSQYASRIPAACASSSGAADR